MAMMFSFLRNDDTSWPSCRLWRHEGHDVPPGSMTSSGPRAPPLTMTMRQEGWMGGRSWGSRRYVAPNRDLRRSCRTAVFRALRPLRKSSRTLRLKFYHKETRRSHEATQSKSVAIVVRPNENLYALICLIWFKLHSLFRKT